MTIKIWIILSVIFYSHFTLSETYRYGVIDDSMFFTESCEIAGAPQISRIKLERKNDFSEDLSRFNLKLRICSSFADGGLFRFTPRIVIPTNFLERASAGEDLGEMTFHFDPERMTELNDQISDTVTIRPLGVGPVQFEGLFLRRSNGVWFELNWTGPGGATFGPAIIEVSQPAAELANNFDHTKHMALSQLHILHNGRWIRSRLSKIVE